MDGYNDTTFKTGKEIKCFKSFFIVIYCINNFDT